MSSFSTELYQVLESPILINVALWGVFVWNRSAVLFILMFSSLSLYLVVNFKAQKDWQLIFDTIVTPVYRATINLTGIFYFCGTECTRHHMKFLCNMLKIGICMCMVVNACDWFDVLPNAWILMSFCVLLNLQAWSICILANFSVLNNMITFLKMLWRREK